MILEIIHLFMFHSFDLLKALERLLSSALDLLRDRNSNFKRQIISPSKQMDGGTNSHHLV